MTTSQQSRLGQAPEEGMKAPVVTISSGQETLFGIGQSIAGVVIADMDRVAINAQTIGTENGIYVARGGKSWERAPDFNGPDDVENGQLLSDGNTSAVYSIIAPDPWVPGTDVVNFGLLLSPVGFFWGAITGTLSNQADLQLELDAKAALVHTHVEADITDLQAYILDAPSDGEFYARSDAAWVVIDFSVFAPAVHTHLESDITDLQAYLLDAPSDNELYARANGAWQGFSTASGTTGEIIAWPDADVPENFLDCNGQSLNAVTFADLFAVLGYKYGGSGANFNVPDLRGTFIRGTANGSGNDPDRTSRTDRGDGVTGDFVGTKQASAIGPHAHTFNAAQAIGGFTDNGGAPDIRTTLQNKDTGTSGPGIGGDTRPINMYMNYIIRYTGGGSGITQPPSIEVQDNSVPLTTAVQLFNFIGFTLTQDVTDQINVRFGSSQAAGQYCPDYGFSFVSIAVWQIIGTDATHLFRAGRRCRFIDGAANYYGTVTSSTFSGGDTTISMSMDAPDELTVSITEVCLVTSATSWSPISEDPFGGDPINDACVGIINTVTYIFAVGNNGKAARSDDGGLTWTVLTTGTTEHLNVCQYDSVNEQFWGGGAAGVLIDVDDGAVVTLDAASIAALPTTGDARITGFSYDSGADALIVLYQHTNVPSWSTASSTDQGATWTTRAALGNTSEGWNNLVPDVALGGSRGPLHSGVTLNNTGDRFITSHDDTSFSTGSNLSPGICSKSFSFDDGGQSSSILGAFNGVIEGVQHWTGRDDTTFSSRVRDFAYSIPHQRLIMVGDDAQIGFIDEVNQNVADAWEQVTNGFDPLTDILSVVWDDFNGVFVAFSDNGQICRSSNGLGDPIVAPTETGFTLIAADPFGGAPITHIRAGAIAGQIYWIACGGSLMFRSIDAGITWSAITHGATGTVVSLTYSPATETFVAGFSAGDLSYTQDGSTTWVVDNTTIAALGVGTRIENIHYFEDTSTWLVMIPNGATLTTTYTAPDITAAVWTVLDVTITVPQSPNMIWDDFGTDRVFWQDTSTGIPYFANGNDTSSQNLVTISQLSVPRTAFHVAAGTLGHPYDMMLGNSNGDVCFFGIVINVETGIFPGNVNGFALSTVANRYVGVGDSGAIFTMAAAFVDNTGNWVEVINPFTSHINAVWYDPSDDIIIAVGVNGQIGRSVDGIS